MLNNHFFAFTFVILAFYGDVWPTFVKADDTSSTPEPASVDKELHDPLGQKCNFSGPGHCPKGFICQKGECVRRCFFMGSCPEGFFCKGNFVCVKKACDHKDPDCCEQCPETCFKHRECPIGWGCVLNKCRRVECRARGDCEFGWPCVVGKCFPPACIKASDCPDGWDCGPTTHRCAKKSN